MHHLRDALAARAQVCEPGCEDSLGYMATLHPLSTEAKPQEQQQTVLLQEAANEEKIRELSKIWFQPHDPNMAH